MFTPQAVHESATPDPNEVLVSGVDENGLPRNVLLRNAPALRASLIANPATLPNPAYDRIAAELEAAMSARDAIAAHLAAIPELAGDPPEPNQDRVPVEAQLASAEQTVATIQGTLDATPVTIPNPARAAIEAEAHAAAVGHVEAAAKAIADALVVSDASAATADAADAAPDAAPAKA